MPVITAYETAIAYDDGGDRDDPAIPLIVSLGTRKRAGPDAAFGLAAPGFRVIRFHHRDVGLSTRFDTTSAAHCRTAGRQSKLTRIMETGE